MCFACGKENPVGPQVGYHVDGDTCTAELVDRIEAEYGNARRWLRVA